MDCQVNQKADWSYGVWPRVGDGVGVEGWAIQGVGLGTKVKETERLAW